MNTLDFQSRAYESMFPAVFGVHAKLTDVPNGGPGLMASDIIRSIARGRGVAEEEVGPKLPEAHRRLAEELRRLLPPDPRPYLLPGIPATLASLREGHALGVISGNAEVVATTLLTWAGVRDLFDVSCFGQEARTRRELIERCIAKYEERRGRRLGRDELAVVGDSAADAEGARAAGVRAIGVTTGFHDREALLSHGADVVISSLEELPRVLAAA